MSAPAAAGATVCDALPGFTVHGKIGEGTFGEVFIIRNTTRRGGAERVFALKKNKARRRRVGGRAPRAPATTR